MQSQNGKTKTAMLIELESIKDLLVEEDNIPTLQEVIVSHPAAELNKKAPTEEVQEVLLLEVTATQEEMELALHQAQVNAQENALIQETSKAFKTEQQQDFFDLTALGELPAPSATPDQGIRAVPTSVNSKTSSLLSEIKPATSSIKPSKPSSQNPFLPEHIRARLQGNNPPPSFVRENITRHNIRSSFSVSTNRLASTKTSQQQQLINDVMDAMLPEIESALRERLEKLSKTALEELLAEQK